MSKTLAEKERLIATLEEEVLSLSRSPLYAMRIETSAFPVIGEGSLEASIMFVGEAPGKNEAKSGKPFCGASGRVLDELLASIQLPRERVYITNIVKDRPPENRDPTREEIALYGPFLERQIAIIEPKVIATLGRFSMQYCMEHFGLQSELAPISALHGKSFTVVAPYGPITLVPLYHPAVAVYNNKTKDTLKADFKALTRFP